MKVISHENTSKVILFDQVNVTTTIGLLVNEHTAHLDILDFILNIWIYWTFHTSHLHRNKTLVQVLISADEENTVISSNCPHFQDYTLYFEMVCFPQKEIAFDCILYWQSVCVIVNAAKGFDG